MNILQIPRPPLHPGQQTVQYPTKVTIDAQALFQILSHALRKQPDQQRVVGTLVGVRSDDGNSVEIKTAYVVPMTENTDEVKIHMDYHSEMFQLVRKAYPDSVILGWYATNPQINNLSGLIHDLYSQEHGTYPFPAIHLTVQTSEATDIDVKTYITSTIGLPGDQSMGSHIFIPIENQVLYTGVDLSAMQIVGEASRRSMRGADLVSPLENIDNSVDELIASLEKVQKYVKNVINGKATPNVEVGKYLYKTASLLPDVVGGSPSKLYQEYLTDLDTVSHLTNSIKSQVKLTSELTQHV